MDDTIIQLALFDGKVCTRCHQWKALSEFRRYSRRCRMCIAQAKRAARDITRVKFYPYLDPALGVLVKTCKECRQVKPVTEFYKQGAGHYWGRCKECGAPWFRAYNAAHPEAARARVKNSLRRHPEQKTQYRHDHPEQFRAYSQNKRARKAAANGTFTKEEWKALKARYGNRCLRCFRAEPQIVLSVDHIVPLSKGGSNSIDNIQPLCGTCNSSKAVAHVCYRPDKLLP